MVLNVPPSSKQAERAVLGAMLVDKKTVDYVLKELAADDFYDEMHIEVYNAIKNLRYSKKAVDIITVSEIIPDSIAYLIKLADAIVTTENLKHYTEMVKEKTLRRELIRQAAQITELAYEKTVESSTELLNLAKQKLDIKIKQKEAPDDFHSILMSTAQEIENNYKDKQDTKLYTEIKAYDRIMAGLHPEELTIIGARPAVGKTTFAVQMMINLASKGLKTLFVSREMSVNQIAKRIISNMSRVNGHKLRVCKLLNDDDWMNISLSIGDMSRWPVYINDRLGAIQDIRAKCQELKDKNMLDVLFVDYLQLLKTHKRCDSKRAEIEAISRELKEISLDMNIPVICLSQLSRATEKDNREPRLSDLRESGSIEQDADNVILLHKKPDEDQDTKINIKVIVAKQRNGATGYFNLDYYPNNFKFYD